MTQTNVLGFSTLKCISGQTIRSSGLKRLVPGSPRSVLSFRFLNGRLVAPPGTGAAISTIISFSRSEEIFFNFNVYFLPNYEDFGAETTSGG